MNDKIEEKIKLLSVRNSNFNRTLTDKLNEIIGAINKFKTTNLQGLTETKDKLAAVTKELQDTKEELVITKTELDRVKTQLVNLQNEIQQTNDNKKNLQQQIGELEGKIRNMEMEYENKINGVRQEISQKTTEEKKNMQQQFDANIAELKQQKNDLEKKFQDAERTQNDAVNRLGALQTVQDELFKKLGTVNEMLVSQIVKIEEINDQNPDYGNYKDLLDMIQLGLSGVITGINDAVSSTPMSVANSSSSTPLYDKFVSLSDDDKQKIYDKIGPKYTKSIQDELNSGNPSKSQINNILNRIYIENLKDGAEDLLRGGRRKRRTMKKRPKKTRKLMKKKQKGGYVYDNSKELDKASSVISHSSGTSKSRTSTSSKRKRRKRRTRKI